MIALPPHPNPSCLNPRERQVASLVRRGLRDGEIASMTSTDVATVRKDIKAIYEKTGVSDRLELAFYAHRYRL